MRQKGFAMEYLIMIAGAIFLAVMVILTLVNIASSAPKSFAADAFNVFCAKLPKETCTATPIDAAGTPIYCTFDLAANKCKWLAAQCNNGLDDDKDNFTDLADPDCTSPSGDSE